MDKKLKIFLVIAIVIVLFLVAVDFGNYPQDNNTGSQSIAPPPTGPNQIQTKILQKNISGISDYNFSVKIPNNVTQIVIIDWNNGTGLLNFTFKTTGKPYYSYKMEPGTESTTSIDPIPPNKSVQVGTWDGEVLARTPMNLSLSIYISFFTS